jgi:hypothetical protein
MEVHLLRDYALYICVSNHFNPWTRRFFTKFGMSVMQLLTIWKFYILTLCNNNMVNIINIRPSTQQIRNK